MSSAPGVALLEMATLSRTETGAAAKAACAAAWIQRQPPGVTIESLRFRPDQVATLRDHQIGPPWSPLTRLKGANPQAFHYWLQAQRILTTNQAPAVMLAKTPAQP